MSDEYRPFNQETDQNYNMEPGIAVVPGSAYARTMASYEQFPSKWTHMSSPGNPYTYRPFPKMLYQAHRYEGTLACCAAPPDAAMFKDPREYERACLEAKKFTESCQKIVQNEREYSRAMESGWREHPQEAFDFAKGREEKVGTATAERLYQDRNMSDRAKAEADLVTAESGGESQPEISKRKVAEAKESRRRRSA